MTKPKAPKQLDAITPTRTEALPNRERVFYVWIDRPYHDPARRNTKPRRRHPTLSSAMAEAQRLATKTGEKVLVLKLKGEAWPHDEYDCDGACRYCNGSGTVGRSKMKCPHCEGGHCADCNLFGSGTQPTQEHAQTLRRSEAP